MPNAMSIRRTASAMGPVAVALALTLAAGGAGAGPVSISLSAEEFAPAGADFADRWADLSVEERRAILTRLSSVRRERGVIHIRAGRRYGQVDGTGRGPVLTGVTIRVERHVDPEAPGFGAGFERRHGTGPESLDQAPVQPVRGPEEAAP